MTAIMSSDYISPYRNPNPYIPQSLSEIIDFLSCFIGDAPTMKDRSGYLPDHNIDMQFDKLVKSFEVVRKKLGEGRYAKLVDLAAARKRFILKTRMTPTGRRWRGSSSSGNGRGHPRCSQAPRESEAAG